MKSLALIPARSGSKGLRNKNITNVCGRPLIDYTIKEAIASSCFDTVMVSTDSQEYATIAKKCGAEVPFLRSEEMSSDSASSWDTVREVLSMYKKLGNIYDYVMLLQPTSPLRNALDIKESFNILKKPFVDSVVSVTEVSHPVQWCFQLPDSGSMHDFAFSPYSYMKRQDLEKYYRENGSIYLVATSKIINPSYDLYRSNCFAYIMPRERSVDIDTELDLIVFEAYLSKKND